MATKKSSSSVPRTEKDESALTKFFIDSLKDIYWAEKNLVKALPKMANNATSKQLKQSIENHLLETQNQVTRLEQIFELLGKKAVAKKCDAMEGLLKEGESIIEETEDGSMTRDVGIIAAAQKVEHYEIATYGTLKSLATILGKEDVASLLSETLEEEKNADSLLSELAESYVNESAAEEN
jgi:ferritin-like metal-binding protein YciE